jgi:electron transfer flavoprotein alpha subunit
MRDTVLQDYRNEPFTKGLTDLVNKHQPEILLLGATAMGRDLAGSVATTLGTGLTADCTELNIDGRALAATRPTFGGSLLCTIMTLAYRPQMATMRPRTAPMPRRDESRSGDIITMALGMIETDVVTKLLEFIPDANRNTVNLAYADIIVTGGKGLKNADNFKLVWELARVLGAEVGATRAVTQAGWCESERQVGQTGKTVRLLYIAAASAARSSTAGMEART